MSRGRASAGDAPAVGQGRGQPCETLRPTGGTYARLDGVTRLPFRRFTQVHRSHLAGGLARRDCGIVGALHPTVTAVVPPAPAAALRARRVVAPRRSGLLIDAPRRAVAYAPLRRRPARRRRSNDDHPTDRPNPRRQRSRRRASAPPPPRPAPPRRRFRRRSVTYPTASCSAGCSASSARCGLPLLSCLFLALGVTAEIWASRQRAGGREDPAAPPRRRRRRPHVAGVPARGSAGPSRRRSSCGGRSCCCWASR